jgi:hypothetical protein
MFGDIMETSPSSPPPDKTEEFERFMATSIRAFDAMMDAVKGEGDELNDDNLFQNDEDEIYVQQDEFDQVNLSRNFSDLADNTVAIVGNEEMVQQVVFKNCLHY